MSVGSKCLRGQSVGGSNCWQGQTFIRVKMSAGSKCLWGQSGCEPFWCLGLACRCFLGTVSGLVLATANDEIPDICLSFSPKITRKKSVK